MIRDRGFITVATGKEKYYKVAYNLLQSYRKCTKDPLPFTIIADRENEYTKAFDDVVLLENPTNSFLDKLFLADLAPYEETVFIDADSLCVANPDGVFNDFANCGDFSFYGAILPFDNPNGWFDYNKSGEYKDKLQFNLCGHGGLYYIRRTEKSREIAALARRLSDNYYNYGFNFSNSPADEPVLAMAMAIEGSIPCNTAHPKMMFYPPNRMKLKVDKKGRITLNGKSEEVCILHFGMANTPFFTYQWLHELISNDYYRNDDKILESKYRNLKIRYLPNEIKTRCVYYTKKAVKKIIRK